jgi:four helix bundle protein
MEDKITTFKDLRVWQKGIELVKEIYSTTKAFPRDEQYGLSSQMRRAAISIPANIAEGFRRRTPKDHRQFLTIALGSCAEMETLAIIARELNYIDTSAMNNIIGLLDHICGMTVNLSKKL